MPFYMDIHSHYNHGVKGDTPYCQPGICSADLPYLIKTERKIGIGAVAFAGSFAAVLQKDYVKEENEHLYRIAQADVNVYFWTVVDPQDPETYVQADRMLECPKCLGIKLHPYFHQYDIADYAETIFSFAAERKTNVLIHPDKIPEISKIAGRHPEMKLILAHLGGLEWIDAIRRYENVFTDTSGSASLNNQIVEYAVECAGAEKIFFGTDTYSPAAQLGRILYADISEAAKKSILSGNAKKYLHMEENSYENSQR